MKNNIIIIIILVVFLIAASGIIYLNNYYLPVRLKAQLQDYLTQKLGYNTKIEKISYNLFQGVMITNLTVFDNINDKDNTILNVNNLHFNVLIFPLFKEKKIIIPVLHIDQPRLYIRYHKDNTFNFSRALSSIKQPAPSADTHTNFSLLISKIDVSYGTIVFSDERYTPYFEKTIQDLDIGIGLTPSLNVHFVADGKFATQDNSFTKISIKSDYNIPTKELISNISLANLKVSDFSSYSQKIPLSIQSGTITDAIIELKLDKDTLNANAILNFNDAILRKWDIALTSNLNIKGNFKYNYTDKQNNYNANIKISMGKLEGLKYAKGINEIAGDIAVAKDKIRTENLKFKALGSDINLKGEFSEFSDPNLYLEFSSQTADLESIFTALRFPANLKLEGKGKASYILSGQKINKNPIQQEASFEITNAKFSAPFLKEPLQNVKGRVIFSKNSELEWSNIAFDYLKTTYSTNGKLSELKDPQINFDISSKDLKVTSDIKIKNKIVNIKTLEAKMQNSLLNLKGTIDTREQNNPGLNLSLNSTIRSEDIAKFLPEKTTNIINKLKILTSLKLSGEVTGNAKNFKDLNISLKGDAELLSLYNLKFENLSFNLIQKNKQLSIPRLSAKFYSGETNASFILDMNSEIPAYQLNLSSKDVDLSQLKMDTDFKDKDIFGKAKINALLSGQLQKIETLKGIANVDIIEGKLWQLNLFKGLGEFFLTPDYKNIVFDEASGTFDIENKTIATDDLTLKSIPLTLMADGQCGFNGDLDVTVYSKTNKELIKDSADIRKFTAAIFGELRNSLAVRITGTIQKPKYSLVPLPLDFLKSIKNFFLGKD